MDNLFSSAINRRSAMKSALTTAAIAAAFSSKVTGVRAAEKGVTDLDILNFALNLEYLEAEFYNRAVYGNGLPASLTGNSTSTVTGGTQVRFADRQSLLFAKEIADDEYSHVELLRSAITAGGGTPVNEPAIDLTTSFTAAAIAAGIIPANGTFNPFANENNFLLGAFIFEDVGVSAYGGAVTLIKSAAYLQAAAQILAVEAYHAGEIRTRLYLGGYIPQANGIAAARAKLSGTGPGTGNPTDDVGISTNGQASIVDANSQGLAYTRTTEQVLSVVYLGQGNSGGGFFPSGVNGAINQA